MVEENKNLLAYCGLYCGDCFAYKGKIAKGKIADLARDLRKELRDEKNLRKIKRAGMDDFIKGKRVWYNKIK